MTSPRRPSRSTSRSATRSPEPSRAHELPVARGHDQRPPGAQHAGHRRERGTPGVAARCVRQRVADAENRVEAASSPGPAGPPTRARALAARSVLARELTRARRSSRALASVATTSKPRSASPTASWPVPAAQSSTRAPGSSRRRARWRTPRRCPRASAARPARASRRPRPARRTRARTWRAQSSQPPKWGGD